MPGSTTAWSTSCYDDGSGADDADAAAAWRDDAADATAATAWNDDAADAADATPAWYDDDAAWHDVSATTTTAADDDDSSRNDDAYSSKRTKNARKYSSFLSSISSLCPSAASNDASYAHADASVCCGFGRSAEDSAAL